MDHELITLLGKQIEQRSSDIVGQMLSWHLIDLLCKLDEIEQVRSNSLQIISPLACAEHGEVEPISAMSAAAVNDGYGRDSGR